MDNPTTNKAVGLVKLTKMGFNVPPFLVFSSHSDFHSVKAEVVKEFGDETLLVVRSSAEIEDGSKQSNAGAYHTEVGVNLDQMQAAWEKVCASMPERGKNQVIIQAFVNGDFSGVAFCDPILERALIEYLPGLCKAVVEGYDTIRVFIEDGNTSIASPVEAMKYLFYNQKDAEVVEATSENRLQESELLKVADKCFKLSSKLDAPQDIEWTVYGDTLYILQTRPITVDPWQSEAVQIYDSANVGESFGGLVQPLTVSFARKLYAQVYKDLLSHSGVSKRSLNREDSTFDNLVDSAYGRMYYRMDNWYRFMSMLPGYKRNKRNLEKMLLLNENRQEAKPTSRPSLWIRLVYYPLVMWKLLRFKSTMKSFEMEVLELLKASRSWKIDELNEKDVLQKLDDLFSGILRKWYLTVENDTVVMSLYAALSKKNNAEKLEQLLRFHSVSTDQVEALSKLSMQCNSNQQVMEALESNDEEGFRIALDNEPGLKDDYISYMHRYGGRFANELKLETPDIEDSFGAFARIINLYRNTTIAHSKSPENNASGLTGVFHRFASRREVFRLHRANMFALVRKLVLQLAKIQVSKGALEQPEDIFFLEWEELDRHAFSLERRKQVIKQRKNEHHGFGSVQPPAFFKVVHGRWPQLRGLDSNDVKSISGIGVSRGRAEGKAEVMATFTVPDVSEIGILVTERTDPGWTALMAVSKGLIVEHGGMLSHASIVARELGIPAVIGVKGACDIFKTGDYLSIDGSTGVIIKHTDNG